MYLTVDQYLTRFGERETAILTNEKPTPGAPQVPDTAKVEDAIVDATQSVEGYIGARYRLPLPAIPPIVATWIAVIARENLHTNAGKIPDAVGRAADRARKEMGDVQKGAMTLPLPEAGTAPESADTTGYASSSMDRETPLFTRSAMDAYTSPFTPSPQARWRLGID